MLAPSGGQAGGVGGVISHELGERREPRLPAEQLARLAIVADLPPRTSLTSELQYHTIPTEERVSRVVVMSTRCQGGAYLGHHTVLEQRGGQRSRDDLVLANRMAVTRDEHRGTNI